MILFRRFNFNINKAYAIVTAKSAAAKNKKIDRFILSTEELNSQTLTVWFLQTEDQRAFIRCLARFFPTVIKV